MTTGVGLLAGLATGSSIAIATAAGGGGAASSVSGSTSAISPDASVAPAAPQSEAEQARAYRGVLAKREAVASKVPGGGKPRGGDRSAQTRLWDPDLSETPSVIRNSRNTRSQVVSSTLAEPAAANDGTEVWYNGNTYFSRSSNSGQTFTADSAIPAGPTGTTIACCDPDVVHKPNLDTTFAVILYTNSANPPTDGAVRIFVRRGTISGGNDCTYTFTTTGSVVPDYPHLAVSNNYLYLTTNNLGTGGWTGAQIRRINATQMANCQTASITSFNYVGSDGQRVLTPVEGATTTMYFGLNRSANTFRILRLPESSSTITAFDRTLSHGSSFTNPDCTGGTGNFDWIQRSTAFSITGFRMRGAVRPGSRVWFSWNVGPDGSHPQGHVHSAVFSDSATNPTLLATPHIHNSSFCFGFPTLGSNADGFFGLTIAAGGNAGAGGTAAQGYIGVDDNSTAGHSFGSVVLTASGTHNRSDGRFGDYFTVRRDDACGRRWVATNYALSGGNTSSSHVNARYVIFRSNNNSTC